MRKPGRFATGIPHPTLKTMNPISFSITRVNRLRRAADKATEFPEFDAGSPLDVRVLNATEKARGLLDVFDGLWLKPGFALWAYAHRDSHGGNGEIRAVPADAVPGASSESPSLDELMVPPPGAIPLMQAIDGDGSPWSYLSASILSREADEFGAWWHGCDWSVQTIVSRAPPQADDPDTPDDEWRLTGEAPAGDWTWHGPVPLIWEPTFREIGTTRQVVLHIRNPVAQEAIYRATDTYQVGSYVGSTESELLCAGPGGIVF